MAAIWGKISSQNTDLGTMFLNLSEPGLYMHLLEMYTTCLSAPG